MNKVLSDAMPVKVAFFTRVLVKTVSAFNDNYLTLALVYFYDKMINMKVCDNNV